jgi:hypothetical protein
MSTLVFDDQHFSLWERGRGSTAENLTDDTKVTIYFRKPQLRADGILQRRPFSRRRTEIPIRRASLF